MIRQTGRTLCVEFLFFIGVWVGAVRVSATETVLFDSPVPVVTSSNAEVFPETWRNAPISAGGGELGKEHYDRVQRVLKQAFSKYPEEVLRQHLKKVVVLSHLRYCGVPTGGTNSATAVYVQVGDVRSGYTDEWLERVFHAEFSSILLRNLDLDKDAWAGHNPPGFNYLGNGVDAIKQGRHGLRLEQQLHSEGFLKEYSKSTLENDFNAFAASIFAGDKAIWGLAEQFPKLQGKLKLTIAFYQAIDSNWTEAKFRSFVSW